MGRSDAFEVGRSPRKQLEQQKLPKLSTRRSEKSYFILFRSPFKAQDVVGQAVEFISVKHAPSQVESLALVAQAHMFMVSKLDATEEPAAAAMASL